MRSANVIEYKGRRVVYPMAETEMGFSIDDGPAVDVSGLNAKNLGDAVTRSLELSKRGVPYRKPRTIKDMTGPKVFGFTSMAKYAKAVKQISVAETASGYELNPFRWDPEHRAAMTVTELIVRVPFSPAELGEAILETFKKL